MTSPGREKGGVQLSLSWWGVSPDTSISPGASGRPGGGEKIKGGGFKKGGGGGGGLLKKGANYPSFPLSENTGRERER